MHGFLLEDDLIKGNKYYNLKYSTISSLLEFLIILAHILESF